MLEASGLLGNPAAAGGGGSATITTADVGGGSVPGVFVEEQEGDRNLSGNRWPREETLALLKIRSDMDVAFRDSSLKAPLWDEVSRKLGELGYYRSGKKCKEKFENIYKYHKRTKECRSGRQNGKNYRFFEQLELLDGQSSLPSPSQRKIHSSLDEKTVEMETEREREKETTAMTMTDMTIKSSIVAQDFTIPSSFPNSSAEFMFSTSTSTTSSSGRESEGNDKKKRKLGDYFDRLMKEILQKQENLQNKFMEALEKCEKDRLARDEAWKVQQLARMKREQEMLAQERAISAAKDAAVIAFLQKISDQQCPVQLPENLAPIPTPNPVSAPTPAPAPTPIPIQAEKVIDKQENEVGENSAQASSSRWPKMEIEALIRLKTNLDLQYQDNGPKGPLWEEISLSMKNLGYNRSAKRCKEKWENINKYYKRVKESNKKRNEASKTCPYFELLESIHERKYRKVSDLCKPEDILMQMVGKAQEPQPLQQRPGSVMEDCPSENVDQNQEDDEVDDDEEDDNGDDYQIVANNPSSNSIME